jgi:hypothetical protein
VSTAEHRDFAMPRALPSAQAGAKPNTIPAVSSASPMTSPVVTSASSDNLGGAADWAVSLGRR